MVKDRCHQQRVTIEVWEDRRREIAVYCSRHAPGAEGRLTAGHTRGLTGKLPRQSVGRTRPLRREPEPPSQ